MKTILLTLVFFVSLGTACGQLDEVSHVAKEPARERERDIHEHVQDAEDTPPEAHFGDSSLPEDDDDSSSRTCPTVQTEQCRVLKQRAVRGIITWKEYHVLCEGPGTDKFLCVPQKVDAGW